MSKQCRDIVMPALDFVLFAEIVSTSEGEKRILHTKPCDYWMAGDKTGMLPETIPFDTKTFMTEFSKAKSTGGKEK